MKQISSIVVSVVIATLAVAVLPAFAEQEHMGEGEMMKKLMVTTDQHRMNMDSMMKNFAKFESNEESVIIRANGDFRVTGAMVNSVNVSGNMLNVSLFGFSRDVSIAGASLVGIGTAVWERGEDVFRKVCEEIAAWCESEGVKDVKELVGAAHPLGKTKRAREGTRGHER